MFIQITDPADNTRILLNTSCILLVRGRAQGGSAVYLSTSASHHPDVLIVRETPEDMRRLLTGASCEVEDAASGAVATPAQTSGPAH